MPLVREPGAPAPYQQIREILRNEVLENMRPGERIAAERDLAKRFAANRATISRAIASLVNEGLLVRRVGRGTFVGNGEDGSRRVITRTVGLVIPYITGDFPGGIIRSAVRACRDDSFKAVLFDSEDSTMAEASELDRLMQEGLDGALVMPVDKSENNQLFTRLVRLGFPIVFLDRRPLDLEADCVASDNFWGAYEAVSKLIARGHKRIAHFTWLMGRGSTAIQQRLDGYKQALLDHDIEVDPELICPPAPFPDSESAFKHIISYLRQGPHPVTAIFTLNDLFAVAAIASTYALGLKIPDDLELATFYDGSVRPTNPEIRFIKIIQDQEAIGKQAVDLLLRRIEGNGPSGPQMVAIKPQIVDEVGASR